MTRLAVLGSPIGHSKSPDIHAAAYRTLGLDWQYSAIEMTGSALPAFVRSLGDEWRGLSLTMPLKRDVLPLLDDRATLVDTVGGANTVLFGESGVRGFNTDVYGIVQAFRDAGVATLPTVDILGAGATAASVLVAARELGCERARVWARTPARAADLVELGVRLGLAVDVGALAEAPVAVTASQAVISTLPGGTTGDLHFSPEIRSSAVLFDVAYDPWPSVLAVGWSAAGGRVVSGLEMLLHQAVGQVRVFVSGDPGIPLPDENRVLAAMRDALD